MEDVRRRNIPSGDREEFIIILVWSYIWWRRSDLAMMEVSLERCAESSWVRRMEEDQE
jgi:hypothetical protein